MKKTLYPKTTRVKDEKIIITEKLDGSNLWIFNLWWEFYIAQRNNIFKMDELTKENSYKWLIWWLDENIGEIDLCEWAWVFWEWIWMGKINYWETLTKKFYIFAKFNINSNFEARNIIYNRDLFIYPFKWQKIPDCMWIVPLVEYSYTVTIADLNQLYQQYSIGLNRPCEWFIINNNNQIQKYVRLKNWKLEEHKPWK